MGRIMVAVRWMTHNTLRRRAPRWGSGHIHCVCFTGRLLNTVSRDQRPCRRYALHWVWFYSWRWNTCHTRARKLL